MRALSGADAEISGKLDDDGDGLNVLLALSLLLDSKLTSKVPMRLSKRGWYLPFQME